MVEVTYVTMSSISTLKTANSTTTILNRPEDWEPWIWELESGVPEDIWALISPDLPVERLQPLLARPRAPTFTDVNQNANTYADLLVGQQRAYHDLRQYYQDDRKQYERQADYLAQLRSRIQTTVGPTKKLLLQPSLSIQEWILHLKQDTAPSIAFMSNKIYDKYVEALRPLRGKTVG